MSGKDLYSTFYQKHRDNYGRKFAIFVAVSFHIAAIAGMWLFSHPSKPKQNLLKATPVTLASNPNRSSGKKSKAPTAGRQRRSKPKKTTTRKPKPVVKKPPPKKTPTDVGTRTEKKPKTKPKPVVEQAEKENPTGPDKTPAEQPVEPKEDRTIPIAKGGFGGLKDSGISFEMGSTSNKVDVKDYEFVSYFRLVHDKIARRWSRGGLVGGTAVIRFEIHRDGSIKKPEIIESAGKPYLDNPAKMAVVGADLPPLPQGIREDILIVDINFHYHNQRR